MFVVDASPSECWTLFLTGTLTIRETSIKMQTVASFNWWPGCVWWRELSSHTYSCESHSSLVFYWIWRRGDNFRDVITSHGITSTEINAKLLFPVTSEHILIVFGRNIMTLFNEDNWEQYQQLSQPWSGRASGHIYFTQDINHHYYVSREQTRTGTKSRSDTVQVSSSLLESVLISFSDINRGSYYHSG